MRVYDDIKQLSDEWNALRLGSVGGSSIASVVAKARVKGSGMRVNLLYQLAGEILSGVKHESYSNKNMDRGIELEDEAREAYEMATQKKVIQVGLVKP